MSSARSGGTPPRPSSAEDVCLLINPLSLRLRYGSLRARAEAMAVAAGVEVILASAAEEIQTVLERLLARRQRRIFVLSGDGTMLAIAQFLAALPSGTWSPELLLLGGGRANVVPRACGGVPALPRLGAALAALRGDRPITVTSQQLLRLEQPGLPPRHGFVLAGAMVDYGIRYCRDYRAGGEGWLRKGLLSDPWALLQLGMKVIIGRSPIPDYQQLRVLTNTGDRLEAPMRILMATTLQYGKAHYNPYADRGTGPVRVTAVAADAQRFWRNLPAVLGGHFDPARMTTQQGYLSGRYEYVDIGGLAGCSLDGEPFELDPRRALRLAAGMPLHILKP